jgi:hypothetical protein
MKIQLPGIATALFSPAILGLGIQTATAGGVSPKVLALALLLLGFEQAHMAGVDLRQVSLVQRRVKDPRLQPFQWVVLGTIAGELVGFYLAAAGVLGGGMLVILISLIGFNLLASIQLAPQAPEPIIPCRAENRFDVLALNGVAVGLALFWLQDPTQPWPALGILAIVLTYIGSKLTTYLKTWRQVLASSPPHIPDSTQQHPETCQQNQQC